VAGEVESVTVCVVTAPIYIQYNAICDVLYVRGYALLYVAGMILLKK